MGDKNISLKEIFISAAKNHQKGNYEIAKNLYKKILDINSTHAETHYNLGVLHGDLGEHRKAISCYESAIQINSNYIAAHYNLGKVFNKLGKRNKAISCYEKAIQIEPKHADSYNALGVLHGDLGEHQKAISCYEKAIQINPNAGWYSNLGTVFKELGEHSKAIFCYEKAIKMDPNYAETHHNLALMLLLKSDFDKGFDEYEWRRKIPSNNYYKEVKLKAPEWRGENLTNKTILILSEQGIGDIIQFARYLYILKDNYSTNIIFRMHKRLVHLFVNSKFKIITNEDTIPHYDFYKYLMSLPQIFYNKTKNFPKQINYIPKNTKIILKWKNKLSKIKGIKIGITWQGNKMYRGDRLRSIPLNFFEPLFTIEKINFINLQKGFGIEQIENFKYKNKLYDFSSEVDNGSSAFEDTIGILNNVDLVISSDTAVPHLSATMGIATWVLLPFSPDWRNFLKIKHSLWYEHIKIYRQEKLDRWQGIFKKVKKDLINEFNL